MDARYGKSARPTRRRVLQGGLAWAAGATLAGTVQGAGSRESARRTLVLLHLSGGNDGLNTVIPYRDPLYRAHRPRLGRVACEALALDGGGALHPSLRALHRLYERGQLAIVQGVGCPEPDYSHRGSCRIWAGGISDVGFRIPEFGPPNPLPFEAGRIEKTLAEVGRAVEAETAARVLPCRVGGFDTHEDQLPQHARVLRELGDGLARFQLELERRRAADRALVMVWSEFGRRPAENAGGGTDHGAAGPVLIMGRGIRGGLYGQMPSLADTDAGNLIATVDFRSLFASLAGTWLGI